LRKKLAAFSTILTYSWCPLIQRTILDAIDDGRKLRVCILDSHPDLHGVRLLDELSKRNVDCCYGLISSMPHMIKECQIVCLECVAVLSSGCVIATRGSCQIAIMAQQYNIPVLVAAPTQKFIDKVSSDANDQLHKSIQSGAMETIPAELITALVTDIRILPPSSAPGVLEAKHLECSV